MSDGGYKIRNKAAVHFLTFAVIKWIDIFTRQLYRDIVVDSLRYCQENRDLLLHGWCLMSNHLHLLAAAKHQDLSEIMRDFKKFTSVRIIRSVEANPGESRKEWMLSLFREQGESNSRNKNFQFWQQDLHPVECYSPVFTWQKLNYVHLNPVRAGIVQKPEDYLYSSALAYRQHCNEGVLRIDFI